MATGPAERPTRRFSPARTLDVPAMFIGGKSDWGVYQNPGALERLEKTICTNYKGTHLVDGAGHWVQQEQPEQVSKLLVEFLKASAGSEGSSRHGDPNGRVMACELPLTRQDGWSSRPRFASAPDSSRDPKSKSRSTIQGSDSNARPRTAAGQGRPPSGCAPIGPRGQPTAD